MSRSEIKDKLLQIAVRLYQTGPGFAQEGVVLREAKSEFAVRNLEQEQVVLDCWHDLFRDGKINWGYDLSNPGFPFFHLRNDPSEAKAPVGNA